MSLHQPSVALVLSVIALLGVIVFPFFFFHAALENRYRLERIEKALRTECLRKQLSAEFCAEISLPLKAPIDRL